MTIGSEVELRTTVHALGILYRGIEELRSEYGHRPKLLEMMAEGPLAEIRKLEAELRAYTAQFEATVGVDVWMTLSGRLAHWSETPSRLLSGSLGSLRKAIQTVASFDFFGRVGSRPTKQILEASDPDVVLLQPGSLRIGLRWQIPRQRSLFDSSEKILSNSINSLFLTVGEIDRHGVNALSSEVAERRRVLLRAVAQLAPSSKSEVDTIGFSGHYVSQATPLLLSIRTKERAWAALREAVAKDEISCEGEIREIDLDKATFKLREVEGLGEVSCRAQGVEFEHVVGALGCRVRVYGRSEAPEKTRSILVVTELDILKETN